MTGLLREALNNYEILSPEVEFIRHNENKTYKVKDKLLNKQYVVRIHKPNKNFSLDIFGDNNHSVDFLNSEIAILNTLNENAEVLVQSPVKNKNDDFITILSDGTPVTLLTWINGKTMDKIELTPEVMVKLGETVGKLHNVFKNYSILDNLKRCSYDKIFLKRISLKLIEGVRINVISSEQFKIFDYAINKINYLICEMEQQNSSKGITHCDLAKSNLIITQNGQIAPIDFGLSGYSYYYMDIGSLFSHFNRKELQNSIIRGYNSIIAEELEIKYIEAFMVFQIILFICTHIDNAHKFEWFNSAINRWSEEFFIPFTSGIKFIFC